MTTKLFGEPVRRREDARLIVGEGRYLDDIGSSAHAAAFVRSPVAHARIVDIDVTDALDVEGLRPDVVEVAALADDQAGVLAPADRLAEQLGRHSASRMAAAAVCTAFLMLA